MVDGREAKGVRNYGTGVCESSTRHNKALINRPGPANSPIVHMKLQGRVVQKVAFEAAKKKHRGI